MYINEINRADSEWILVYSLPNLSPSLIIRENSNPNPNSIKASFSCQLRGRFEWLPACMNFVVMPNPTAYVGGKFTTRYLENFIHLLLNEDIEALYPAAFG